VVPVFDRRAGHIENGKFYHIAARCFGKNKPANPARAGDLQDSLLFNNEVNVT
ncbi:MAG: hypothetical protein RL742_1454, partial [Bacteroidota bacterium]